MSVRERRRYEVQCDRCDDAWEDAPPHIVAASPELAEGKVIASFGWVAHGLYLAGRIARGRAGA